jgi:hypothetical protein
MSADKERAGRKPDSAKPVAAASIGVRDFQDQGRAEVCVGGLGAFVGSPYRVASPCAGFEPLPSISFVVKCLNPENANSRSSRIFILGSDDAKAGPKNSRNLER